VLLVVTAALVLLPLRVLLVVVILHQMSKRLRTLYKLTPPVEELLNVLERVPTTHMLWVNKWSVPKPLVKT
jgi:hypothetical protein